MAVSLCPVHWAVVAPKLAYLLLLLRHLPHFRALRDPEGAKGSSDIRSTHGRNWSECVAAACLANAFTLPLKGRWIWPY